MAGHDDGLTLRAASLDDLEDLTTVAQAAWPDDPQFDYRFPYRDEYPQDNRKWVRQEYREYLEQPDKYAVLVVTARDNHDRAVALAVWDISVRTKQKGGGK